jgi:tyramine---L-glutamate ligase
MFVGMKLFLYECATALPFLDVPASIRREGRAMFDALRADALAIPGLDLLTLKCPSPSTERTKFQHLAAKADWSLIVAPETDGILLERCHWVAEAGGRFLGPMSKAIRLTGDKWGTYLAWKQKKVRTPETWLGLPSLCPEGAASPSPGLPLQRLPWEETAGTSSPMVAAQGGNPGLRGAAPSGQKPHVSSPGSVVRKLRDGAGSLDMCLLQPTATTEHDSRWLWQQFVPGLSTSIAFLIGPAGNRIPLLPATQHLAEDGSFRYLGGILPLESRLAPRAQALAKQALDAIPGLLGFVGVDMVLGNDLACSQDYAIEINPRLTTSYVGLRAMAEVNLLGVLLDVVMGKEVPPILWKTGSVTFDALGQVQRFP